MSIVKPQADFNRDSQSSHLAFSQSINVEINIIFAWGKLEVSENEIIIWNSLEQKKAYKCAQIGKQKEDLMKKGWTEDEIFVEICDW